MNQHEASPRRRPSAKRRAKKQALWTLGAAAAVILLCIACLPRLLFQGTIPVADSASVAALPARAEETAGSVPEETPEPEKEPEPVVETIRFSATGDDLIHSPIYKQAQRRATGTEKYSFDYCYEHIAPFYAQQDVNWINQETLCNDELEPSSYPCFSTPGDCARALYRAGVRVFSLSNNHTYDKGAAGIAATLRFWESMPEDVVTTGLWRGTEDYGRIPLQTINGVTIAYLSYTEHTNGIPQSSAMPANIIYTSQTDVIEQQVRAARQQADFVVVGVHWGVENSHTIVDSQRTLAQNLANWGADLIIGTHPHVLQDAEWLTAEDGRKVFTAYSLGNFLSTQNQPDQLVGAILTVQLQKVTNPDGSAQCTVLEPKLHPTVTHYDAGKSNVRTYLLADYTDALAKHTACGKLTRRSAWRRSAASCSRTLPAISWHPRKTPSEFKDPCIPKRHICYAVQRCCRLIQKDRSKRPVPGRTEALMYGVSKINIEPSLMMISVQDVEFKGNGLARYLQIFADNGVVVDMISQSAPHGTTIDFSFTASSSDLPLVMKAISAANLDKDAKASPLISVGYSKLNLFGEEMVTSCGVAARALNALAIAGIEVLLVTTSDLDISLLVHAENEDAAYEALKKAYEL